MKRDYPDRPIVGVGAIIVQDEHVIVIRRNAEPLKGEWSIPGGVVELGETLRQAAAREALEETGLVVDAGKVVEVFDSIYSDASGRTQYHYVLIDFLCRPVGGQIQAGSDASDVRWARSEELDSLGMRPNTVRVLRKALAAKQP
ncbi:MAG TPA: NUDIX hydrolase [Terriglobales bacterium]|nr:NUDIX hydrolase [Terriglobales bacterium]